MTSQTGTAAPSANIAPAPGSQGQRGVTRIGLDRAMWIVVGAAVGIRVVWVAIFARVPSGLSDPLLYDGFAQNIAAGNGYRSILGTMTSYYPPGYPYFLGAIYKAADVLGLDGHRGVVVGVAQSLLWGVAVGAVIVAGRHLWNRRVGLVAGSVLALWPNLITYAGAYLSETLFVAAFAVAVAGLAVAGRVAADFRAERPSGGRRFWGAVVVAAVATAVATMIRPQVLLGVPLVLLAWAIGGFGWRRVAGSAAVTAIAVAAFIVPWSIRNQGVFGHVVPVSTNTGDNLCVGFHPGAGGGFEIPPYCDTGEMYVDGPDAEYRRDRETRARALDFVMDEPLALPWLSIRKLWYTYRYDGDALAGSGSYGADPLLTGAARGLYLVVDHIVYFTVLAASLVGLVVASVRSWRSRPRDGAVLAAVALAVAGLGVPVLFFGDARFKAAVTPMLALFAAFLAVDVVDRLTHRERTAT